MFFDLQEQESAQASEQHCVQLEKARRELERQLSGLSDRLEEEEACSAQLALQRDRLQAECSSLRRDVDELESALTAAEQDKQVERDVIFTDGLPVMPQLELQFAHRSARVALLYVSHRVYCHLDELVTCYSQTLLIDHSVIE